MQNKEQIKPKKRTKTGGRKKGTPNRLKGEIKEKLRLIVEDKAEEFEKRLSKLSDSDFVKSYISLLAYVVPKKQSITTEEAINRETAVIMGVMEQSSEEAINLIANKMIELQQ
jgi:hypothetical protein